MCGRFNVVTSARGFVDLLQILVRLDKVQDSAPCYNVAPTNQVLAVCRSSSENEAQLVEFRWGFIPHWAKDMSIGNRLINARSETAGSKPAFRSAYKFRRCLIAADGWYEWKRINGRKQPYNIRRADRAPFYFAGLWASWEGVESRDKVIHVESCTILTADACDSLNIIHPRMPVVLAPGLYEQWIDSSITDTQSLQRIIENRPMDVFEAYEVSTYVNKPTNDLPKCIEPIRV